MASFKWPASGGGATFITSVSDTATIDLDVTLEVLTANINNDSITNAMINSAAAIAYSKLALTDSIVNADINSAAAITYSKLALTDSIVNADINSAAAITYSKLALTDSIVNADINSAAAIAYSKLNLTGEIVNADINASAAIAYSKLALANSIVNADISSSAAIVYSKLDLSDSIVNADINSAAAIAYSKLSLSDSIVNADINSAAAIAYSKLSLSDSILNADINSAAAIAGTKIDPDFGSQVVETTGKLQGGTVLAGGTTMDASAVLQSDSTDKGFLPPRMTEAQRDAIVTPASGLAVYNTDTNQLNIYNGSAWGAVGGGTYVDTFTGTTVTTTNDPTQKFRYTGVSAQTLATLTFADLPDGGRLILTGSSNTNTLTIPEGLTNVTMNGARVLYQYSTIEFIKDNTQLIEVSRNGI